MKGCGLCESRRGGGIALCVRERIECTVFAAVRDGVDESLWVRVRGMENKAGVIVGAYYQTLREGDSAYELLYKLLEEISESVALVLIIDFNFSDINKEYHTPVTSKFGKLLKYVEDNFMSKTLCESRGWMIS